VKRSIIISGDVIGEVENFKYLGSFVQENGNFGLDVNIRLSAVECNGDK
jgi:hypothetical protein